MPRAAVDRIELYYEIHGPEDAGWLVLSNGVLMSTASWAYQVPELAQYYRLLLYDCRGMWQSDHPPGPYTMELEGIEGEELSREQAEARVEKSLDYLKSNGLV